MEAKKILLIDDEPDILEMLQYNLEKEGYNVSTAQSGDEGIEIAKKNLPDIILLDLMMPQKDGLETCREMRRIPELQSALIVFLSARSEEFPQLAAFDAGADDYVVKVIKPKVLVSKLNALSKLASQKFTQNKVVKIGDLTIDRDSFKVTKDAQKVLLPRKEFELLFLLASNSQKFFSRDEIMEKVWGNDVVVGDRTIDVHIRRLREKFGDGSIKTLKGVGWKWASVN